MKRWPWLCAVVSTCGLLLPTSAQTASSAPVKDLQPSYVAELGLPRDLTQQLQTVLAQRDYIGAEKLLLPVIADSAAPGQKAKVLTLLGSVYFSAGDVFQAAVAWKKADALAPLPSPVRFSLAMAYVRLGHREWARAELLKLAAQQPREALYPYWLGRLAYDAHLYNDAVAHFQTALALNNKLARAHDNLGLCLFYLNRNGEAEEQFQQAIALEQSEGRPSAWPHLNLALVLKFTDRLDEAATELRRAIAVEPGFAQAWYELGTTLEQQGKLADAIEALRHATELDVRYPEPHVALAQLLRRRGDLAASQREVKIYQRLRAEQKETPAQTGVSSDEPH